ncbi:LysR family transcriptional regulator, glycine cleavage system transcriptional activator [Oceanospirillum multiglobuliferum]|uniref:HTH lysR-type domain-containing protein n=1 Tax=Oceanospirillum multiglobuliferum TaxID=64969 RepID=A0A1T4MGN0_9GAMM|nr:LysR substrate-binding domain-containing protein [Oceanospirillum multiglobuliferum]OPX57029.1 hypothetical protein BTE48_00945 [Oceanospirillum multiglobuliferum]SJZ66073.1 LysR family transcriptional regulator, glycine cleavage system transcriptional activator [Oceanospirillum multiglobuliferum]
MSERTPSLKSLHIFAVAAELGSFKQAAEHLCVTPQAVSLQIRSLEEQLNLALFIRHPSGIELSLAGEQLLGYVQRGVALIEQGVKEVKKQQQKIQLRVSASPWFAVHCLLPRLPEFESQYPNFDVRVTTSVPFPDFTAQHLDLAVQWGFGQWPFSHKQLLLTDDKLLVCAPSLLRHKPLLVKEDLVQHRLLCTALSVELWRKLLNTMGVDALIEKQTLPLDSHAGLLEAAVKGLGVALISVADARQAIADGRLVAPLGDRPISELNPALMPGYWLVQREGALQSPSVALFVHAIFDWLKNHPRRVKSDLNTAKMGFDISHSESK